MLPFWGELQKSQDDPQTIAEAITAAIAEHNDDPESHLGEGQSLQNHKSEDVVDHPQGSVLADKWSHTELDFTTTFENPDIFNLLGSPDFIWPGFFAALSASGIANAQGFQGAGSGGGLPFDTAKNMLLQFSFAMDGGANDRAHFRLGSFISPNYQTRAGMGWEVVNMQIVFFAGNATGSSVNTLNGPILVSYQKVIVRMFNNKLTGLIECYVDGSLIGTLSWPSAYTDAAYLNGFLYATTTPVLGELEVYSAYFSIEP